MSKPWPKCPSVSFLSTAPKKEQPHLAVLPELPFPLSVPVTGLEPVTLPSPVLRFKFVCSGVLLGIVLSADLAALEGEVGLLFFDFPVPVPPESLADWALVVAPAPDVSESGVPELDFPEAPAPAVSAWVVPGLTGCACAALPSRNAAVIATVKGTAFVNDF